LFDSIIHQPTRTLIVSLLISNDELSFKQIKDELNLTDGNLSSHMKLLEKEEYIEVEKLFVGKRPKTIYKISEKGAKAFKKYIENLKKFMEKNR